MISNSISDLPDCTPAAKNRIGPVFFLLAIFLILSCSSKTTYETHEMEWQEADGYRWAELPEVKQGRDGFVQVAPDWSGVDFINSLTDDQIAYNRNLLNGSGVAVGDVTGNGFADIYFCRLNGPNVLYENQGGLIFRDITEEAGVALPEQFSTGALFADLNGNGLLDLVVTAIGSQNRIFFNEGGGVFSESENALEQSRSYGSTSIAAADLTGNGALDLYITNFKERSVRDIYPEENTFRHIVERDGEDYKVRPKFNEHYMLDLRDGRLIWFELGEPDLLYFNDGEGGFTKIPLDSGVFIDTDGNPVTELYPDWGLDVMIHDMNGNGLPDIYIANDFESPDRIWINQGNGTFKALPDLAIRKSSLSAMAVDFSDINRNGLIDFFVVEMLSQSHVLRQKQMSTLAPSTQKIGVYNDRPQFLGNTMYYNRGDTTWAEIAEYSGVQRSDWSWTALFLDINLNGYEDVVITNGHFFDVQNTDVNTALQTLVQRNQVSHERMMLEYPRLNNQNVIFRNNGDLTFTDVSSDWGFTEMDISHGMAMADLNNDGYPDLVINRIDQPALILANQSHKSRIAIKLTGLAPNTNGVGAKIVVEGGPVQQSKVVTSGRSYLSSSDYINVFAAGDAEKLDVTVYWPGGTVNRFEGLASDRIYNLHENPDAFFTKPPLEEELQAAIFSDETSRLNHTHTQENYDDFERQPLLPKKLSQKGPGIAFLDVTGNGRDELIITGGRNQPVEFFEAGHAGDIRKLNITLDKSLDIFEKTAIAGWHDNNGKAHVIVGYSGYHSDAHAAPAAVYYTIENGMSKKVQVIPGFGSAAGSVHLADYSGNGYPDLLITGSVIPGRFPEPADSRLYVNNGTRFEADEVNNRVLERVGLVEGALFSDITGNGKPELVLAVHWGNIRVFTLDSSIYREITAELGFDRYKGMWNGIAAGDLTGNGRLDLVAANWGLNTHYSAVEDGKNYIYYEDPDNSGVNTVIEAYYSGELNGIVPRRNFEMLARNPPYVGPNARTFSRYAESTLEQILARPLRDIDRVEANTLEHMVFIQNDDGTFSGEPLHYKAQFAPAFGVIVSDFTGDGHEDVFLSQNFFAYIPETPRSDGGRGLLLSGDGKGNLTPVYGQKSGVKVYGEQRAAAISDFTNDGAINLVVTQNGTDTRLLSSAYLENAIKVALRGNEKNPSGIGAKINLVYGDGTKGPVREIQAGSGYRSQNSFTQILVGVQQAKAVEVHWPDGNYTFSDIKEGTTEIVVVY